jgi:16S rRNA (adenine1518-N6/adenine1519-N6)-dimethyltransferase
MVFGTSELMIELKKSLGQNFFTNENLAKKIVTEVIKNNPKSVVEIGPGAGAFTSLLYPKVEELILVEKDSSLISTLNSYFPNATVLNEDILNVDITKLPQNSVIFGSLPYNISKRIIMKFISSGLFNDYYFIIQKEVAQKYTAKAPNSNKLGIFAQIFVETEILFDISKGNFKPQPKVTSSFIHMHRKEEIPPVDVIQKMEVLVNKAFKSPRKKLRNNLNKESEYSEMRAQELSLDDYLKLVRTL